MKKLKIYFGLLEAVYGTPRNLKMLRYAFGIFLFVSFFAYMMGLVYISFNYGILPSLILVYLFFTYWFRWVRNCERLSARIRKMERKDFFASSYTELEILIENITYYFQCYHKALEHAEKNFKLDSLKEVRWELISGQTNLKGVDKYQLLIDVEEMISRKELKKETAI